MFTYLNQKYGLKKLIIEWAAAIVNGIKLYMKEDTDVALFAKILKNEIEEDFRYIQEKIKVTVSKVLKTYLRDRYKTKSESQITYAQERIESGYLSNSALVYILNYIYEDSDKSKINDLIASRKKFTIANKSSQSIRNVTPPKASFSRTNLSTSPLHLKSRDVTPVLKSKSRSRLKLRQDFSNDRDTEKQSKITQDSNTDRLLYRDLLHCI